MELIIKINNPQTKRERESLFQKFHSDSLAHQSTFFFFYYQSNKHFQIELEVS